MGTYKSNIQHSKVKHLGCLLDETMSGECLEKL